MLIRIAINIEGLEGMDAVTKKEPAQAVIHPTFWDAIRCMSLLHAFQETTSHGTGADHQRAHLRRIIAYVAESGIMSPSDLQSLHGIHPKHVNKARNGKRVSMEADRRNAFLNDAYERSAHLRCSLPPNPTLEQVRRIGDRKVYQPSSTRA